jgi:hypothetical protein
VIDYIGEVVENLIISSAIQAGHGVSVASNNTLSYSSVSDCGIGESGYSNNTLILTEVSQGKTVINPQQRNMFFGVN